MRRREGENFPFGGRRNSKKIPRKNGASLRTLQAGKCRRRGTHQDRCSSLYLAKQKSRDTANKRGSEIGGRKRSSRIFKTRAGGGRKRKHLRLCPAGHEIERVITETSATSVTFNTKVPPLIPAGGERGSLKKIRTPLDPYEGGDLNPSEIGGKEAEERGQLQVFRSSSES